MVVVFKINSKYVGIIRSLATTTLSIPIEIVNKVYQQSTAGTGADPEPCHEKTQLRSWSRSHAYENRELRSRSHLTFTRAPKPCSQGTRRRTLFWFLCKGAEI